MSRAAQTRSALALAGALCAILLTGGCSQQALQSDADWQQRLVAAISDEHGYGAGGGTGSGAYKVESVAAGTYTLAAVCAGTEMMTVTVLHSGSVAASGTITCGATSAISTSWSGDPGIVIKVTSPHGEGRWAVAVNAEGWSPQQQK